MEAMMWNWMPAIVSLLIAIAVWGWLAWQRASLRRLRQYDASMEKFARAAHQLLKYDDLPEDIASFIEIINDVTESERLSKKAIQCLVSSKSPQKENERIRTLEAFFECHEKAKRWFVQMVDAGLKAVLYRVGAGGMLTNSSILRHLLMRHMLKEEAVAVAIGQNACHQGG